MKFAEKKWVQVVDRIIRTIVVAVFVSCWFIFSLVMAIAKEQNKGRRY